MNALKHADRNLSTFATRIDRAPESMMSYQTVSLSIDLAIFCHRLRSSQYLTENAGKKRWAASIRSCTRVLASLDATSRAALEAAGVEASSQGSGLRRARDAPDRD